MQGGSRILQDPERLQNELRSTLEDWIIVGLKLGHRLPVISSINGSFVKKLKTLVRTSVSREAAKPAKKDKDQGLRQIMGLCFGMKRSRCCCLSDFRQSILLIDVSFLSDFAPLRENGFSLRWF